MKSNPLLNPLESMNLEFRIGSTKMVTAFVTRCSCVCAAFASYWAQKRCVTEERHEETHRSAAFSALVSKNGLCEAKFSSKMPTEYVLAAPFLLYLDIIFGKQMSLIST